MMEYEKVRPAGMSLNSFCKYLGLTRSTFYYKPKGETPENLCIMEKIDKFFLEHPTTGVKKMTGYLRNEGFAVNEKRVRRLMRKMCLMAIYPQKSLSKGGAPKYFHPYLLRHLDITHRNQVWSTDISYIPMKDGFMYLYAVIDVFTRYIVGWRLSNTLTATNAYELMRECIRVHGAPEIVNSDQGSQYTTKDWQDLLTSYGIQVSMDGRGRCKDNIWIERFWRSIKQEYIYLNPAENVSELRSGIADYVKFYNYERPHQSLDNFTPASFYGNKEKKVG